MARDKLITIRIEGEKREAFNNLAKSQNTDTASLLYDFINQCLSGTLDISLVTGKGNRIDKIDNQIGSDRIDKLETATQEIDNRLGKLSKKLTDWIEAFDDRLTDCDRELSDKMISLEHRLNTLAIQLDSQQDRQGETPDIEPVATVETAIDTVESVDEPDTDAIATVRGDTDSSIETVTSAYQPSSDSKPWYTIDELLDCHYPGWPETKEGLRKKALREHWPKRTRRGSKGNPYEYQAVLPG